MSETNKKDTEKKLSAKGEKITHKEKDSKQKIQEKQSSKKQIDESIINELKTKLKDSEDKLLRALAENDNLRKRHDVEIENNSKYGIKNFAYELLSVVDNFQRAIDSIPQEKAENDSIIKNLVHGIKAVEKDFLDALEKNGVVSFSSLNKKFNPEIHQAVSKKNSNSEDGTIIEELQKGFMISDRLLRPSMVVVSMGPEKK